MRITSLLWLFLFLMAGFFIQAQHPPACGFDPMHHQIRNRSGDYRQKMERFNQQAREVALQNFRMTGTYNIPVVVHVVHNNGPENIAITQGQTAIQHLNQAFRNQGPYFFANGVDTQIEFCLAIQDPNGNPHSGITYTQSALTNLTAETQDSALKNLIRWNPLNYLNIYVVREITSLAMGSGVAGYAYLPSSHGNLEDGIVVEALYFGSNVNDSKVTVHEAGHYLGLYHTFEGGCPNSNCLNEGDFVCDTPPDQSVNPYQCGAQPNTCQTDDDDLLAQNPFRPTANGGIGDQLDMFINYMDYGLQVCQTAFTAGQKNRMVAAITGARASLLNSVGCQTLCTNPIAINFNSSAQTVSLGNLVNFTNTTTGASSFNWTVNGTPFASTTNASYTFLATGYYIITLFASNADPACNRSFSDTILVQCPAQASFTTPFTLVNPGANVTFTNNSTGVTGSTTWQWLLDANPVSTAQNYSHIFLNPGGFTVQLIACDGGCCDTSTTTFMQVGGCPSREIEVWHFGSLAGVTFASGAPVALTTGAMTSNEGCASICNASGTLQAYSNGVSVWNRNHLVMPNGSGLMGHLSSTQSAMLIPWPDSVNRYVLLTTDAIETGCANGLRYSVIDMNLNGGLGDIIPSMKNLPLLTSGATEKITGTWHQNGRDIWILTHKNTTNEYYAWLLTPTGISGPPVITQIGSAGQKLHGMRMSPNGKKVASSPVASSVPRIVDIMDFDPATGILSNNIQVVMNIGFSWQQPYGLEFSPDNSKLYITTWNGQSYLHQVDLSAGGAAAVIASLTQIYLHVTLMGHMALGPDGKIYVACAALGNLGKLITIEFPNQQGIACGVTVYGVDLLGRVSGSSLPNLFPGFYRPFAPTIVGPDTVCSGNAIINYSASNVSATDSTRWETSPGIGTISQGLTSADFQFPQTGNFSLILHKWNACGYRTDTMNIYVQAGAGISLGQDTADCSGAGIVLSPGSGFVTYLWDNGDTTVSRTVFGTGTYWVEVLMPGNCIARDSLNVLPANLPPVNLGPDFLVCQGGVFTLNAGSGYANYHWQNGLNQQIFTAWTPGTYSVEVADFCGMISRDTVVVGLDVHAGLNLGPDTNVCNGNTYLLDGGAGQYSYFWNNGSTGQVLGASTPGMYWVEVVDVNGCLGRDSVVLNFYTPNGTSALFSFTITTYTVQFHNLSTGPGLTATWDFGDGGSSSLFAPAHTYSGNGIYNVCMYLVDNCGFRDTLCSEVIVLYNSVEGENSEIIAIFPNPSSGELFVRIPDEVGTWMRILDAQGREVFYSELEKTTLQRFQFEQLAKGIYSVEISTAFLTKRMKWLKE